MSVFSERAGDCFQDQVSLFVTVRRYRLVYLHRDRLESFPFSVAFSLRRCAPAADVVFHRGTIVVTLVLLQLLKNSHARRSMRLQFVRN